MKAIITETKKYEVEIKDEKELFFLRKREKDGFVIDLNDKIASETAQLTFWNRTIEEKW